MKWTREFGDYAAKIQAQYANMGRAPGENVADPPQITETELFFFTAYQELSTDRPPGGYNVIPRATIKSYAEEAGADFQLLKTVIWMVDNDFLEYLKMKSKQEADAERARLQQQQSHGGQQGHQPRRVRW